MLKLEEVNFILSVGSVDGVCTSAAVLRNIIGSDIKFCQAFTVDKVDPAKWPASRTVLLVDLAVNNKDKAMTTDFLKRVIASGHKIFGILDEHNAEDWQWACIKAGIDFDKLAIKPVSQDKGEIKSSGALLLSVLGDEVDEHTRELCLAADAGDRMDFSTHFGGLVNQAVKSSIADDSRRVHLARHFAINRNPDEKILGWVKEYESILDTNAEVIAKAEYLDLGLVEVDCVGKNVDMTALMNSLYQDGYYVVVVEGEMFNKALSKKTRQVSFGVKPGVEFDILQCLKNNGIEASGFASKANINPEDKETAILVVQEALPNELWEVKKVEGGFVPFNPLMSVNAEICPTEEEAQETINEYISETAH